MLAHFRQILRQYHLFLRCNFSKKALTKQLILYTPEQIQKMHIRKDAKSKVTLSWTIEQSPAQKTFRVSLVGLPNCGKSSLFNCLVGKPIAIVDSLRGMTRERKEYSIMDGLVTLVDTPGVEINVMKGKEKTMLKNEIFKQTVSAIHESDLILYVVDGKNPLSSSDVQFAKYIKHFATCSIILVCNKCDNLYDEGDIINETSKLGLDTMFPVSANEGTGVIDLLQFIDKKVPYSLKSQLEYKKKLRRAKFEDIIKKMKIQIAEYNKNTQNAIKIKDWQSDFRDVNLQPQNNQALDEQDSEMFLTKPSEVFSQGRGALTRHIRLKNTIKVCFMGRPNVGKSSLINEILGQQKLIVSSEAGTTRDAIKNRILYKGRRVEIIDTAGLDSPHFDRGYEEYEKKVRISTMIHMQDSHVVVFVIDAFQAFRIDEFSLIQRVIEEGRPIVIAVNKWEAVKEKYRYKARNYLLKQLSRHLGELHGDPLVFVSAKMHLNLDLLFDKVISAYDKWNTRISTGLLNNWLSKFKKLDPLPQKDDLCLKINYVVQAKVRPPLFIFFVNSKRVFRPHYKRFMMRNLAKEFGMDGIPFRQSLRSTNKREKRYKKVRANRHKGRINQKMDQLKKRYANFGFN